MKVMAESWLALHERRSEEAERRLTEIDAALDLSSQFALLEFPEKLAFVSDVLTCAPDPWQLANLGSGPLEEMLRERPDETLAFLLAHPQIEAVALALGSVWSGGMAQDVADRIERVRQNLTARAKVMKAEQL